VAADRPAAASAPPTPRTTPPTPAASLVAPTPADASTSHPAGDELDQLQLKAARKVAEIISRNRAFDTLLHNSLEAIYRTDHSDDIDDLKQVLVDGIEALIESQPNLGDDLYATTTYLNAIHTDRRRLRDALEDARKNSAFDDVTGLPNRAAFMRQLESEIGRAKRYGFSLVVAIIDIDDFVSITRDHGRAVGDAVIQCYANDVMSQFRGYDLVARYGDDGFAVLFPNTQKDGALRALEKAQKRAAETFLHHADRTLPLPSFSSVLTVYSPGEKPTTLVKRASEALHQAKLRGPGQVVVALAGG
jgi:diguanylate cyclase (GGDEF)-like protein